MTESFFLGSSWGLAFFALFPDPKVQGTGLIRLLSSVAFCLGLTALLLGSPSPFMGLGLGALGILAVFCREGLWWPKVLGLVAFFFLSAALAFLHLPDGTFLLFAVASGLLVGAVTYGMLLGHWYLVTPKLSTRPLKLVFLILWPILLFKMAFSGREFFLWDRPHLSSFYLMALSLRIVWGYLIVFVMAVYARRLVGLRSLQSATGMLYAMVFFVLVGELVSHYAAFFWGALL